MMTGQCRCHTFVHCESRVISTEMQGISNRLREMTPAGRRKLRREITVPIVYNFTPLSIYIWSRIVFGHHITGWCIRSDPRFCWHWFPSCDMLYVLCKFSQICSCPSRIGQRARVVKFFLTESLNVLHTTRNMLQWEVVDAHNPTYRWVNLTWINTRVFSTPLCCAAALLIKSKATPPIKRTPLPKERASKASRKTRKPWAKNFPSETCSWERMSLTY